MEPEVVKTERRGRKRKRKEVQSAVVDQKSNKKATATRSKVLVGRYVKKEFEGSGIFLGKIISYDTGLYRVDYEDGDCEDLESGEVKLYLVGDGDMDDDFFKRKKNLDEYVSKKNAKDEVVQSSSIADQVETVSNGNCDVENAVELANVTENSSHGGGSEVSGDQVEVDDESSSDSSDYEQCGDLRSEVEPPSIPPPQLPPSSGNIGVLEEHVPYLLSVYSFLRSFSVCLFLSPFGLDEFVGALNSSVPNTLLDAIHVALMRALKSHVEVLSSEGSELASKCLRSMNWSLLDSLTWPVFIVQYLMTMRYTEGPEWKEFYVNVLEKDYYTLSAGRKLIILQLLCDEALDSAELRAEVDMREESEVGSDPDGVNVFTDESGPRRVHPRYSKTSACKDQEAVNSISEGHTSRLSISANSLASKAIRSNAGTVAVDVDEDGNGDECRLCGMDGTLICCDGCPSAYHSRCIGVSKMFIPEGAWYCPECIINRMGPNVTKTTSLRGAEFFGVDPYEQIFLGTCDHLLVMKASGNLEPHLRYYNPTDVQKVLSALNSSKEYRAMYSGICKNMLQFWEIPDNMLYLTEPVGLEVVHGEYSTPRSLLAKESNNAPVVTDAENVLSGVTEINSEDMLVAYPDVNCTETRYDNASLDKVKEFHQLHQDTVEHASYGGNFKDSATANVETTKSSASVSLQHFPSELTQQCLGGKLSIKESATCASGNVNIGNRNHVDTICDASSSRNKEANQPSGKRGYGSSADGCLYMGLSFKPQAYLNLYIQGDFAASAAASLAILSSEESRVSQVQPSSNHRKMMSANLSLQTKAFSLAAKRFCWPNSEKKLVEVPRERCGWCLSCKASVSSKRGCLLNAAASNAIKGATKILASLRPSKNVEGSLASIATYVMFMEESLCGLTVGPFLSPTYRIQWRKQVEQAATLTAIKASLLEFEENIRSIAFSADWIKLVDDMGLENPATQTVSVVGSTQKRGPGRRGRKPSIIPEVADGDGEDISTGFVWWRGGMLSKHIFQKGILPQSMIKNAARHGGTGKINGVHYAEGFDVPKRSRRLLWRAAVEMSKNASQLAIQVRYLDLYVRWNDLVRPEQPLHDGKGPETEASAFRNACIVDRKVVEGKLSYGVVFGNQKHLPSRVLKNTLEVEENGNGKEKYWFTETRIPLYLIKEYEKKVEKVILPSSDKHTNTLPSLQRKQLKASGKNIFSFLSLKRDNLGKCCCSSCQLDVSFRNAVKCSVCQGYCHEQCTVSSNVHMKETIEFFITCKQCYHEKATRNENMSDSPDSPLLLQGQESQHAMTIIKGGNQNGYRMLESLDLSSQKMPATNHPTVTKSGKQNGYKRPLASSGILDPLSEKKEATNRPSVTKGGKQNGHKRPLEYFDQSSGKKPPTNDSTLGTKKSRSKLSLGLIWKKKNLEDTGINFRLKHILLKDNPNGHLVSPTCHLCNKPYDSSLMYIRCEFCEKWYHADAVELEESKIFDLAGFKCCRCRRIRSPVCPYTDPETKKKLEAKKPHLRTQKQANSGIDSNSEANDDEQVNDWELDTIPVLDTKEEAVNVQEDDSLLLPIPMVDQANQHDSEVDFDCGAGPLSGPGPQKLPVRRHVKSEKESDGSSANNLASEPSATYGGSILNPTEESSTPIVEWDVSMNGIEDDMMFDYEGLNYEDMEFEPQTYFSFKELLASDDGAQPDGVDPSGDMIGNWDNSSAALGEDCNPEQYQMGITYDQQEPMFSVEAAVDIVPCRVCSQTEPCPDLSCQICGIRVHSCCSPWDEQSSLEGSWKCGNCREWR